jgi:hypothetical protein
MGDKPKILFGFIFVIVSLLFAFNTACALCLDVLEYHYNEDGSYNQNSITIFDNDVNDLDLSEGVIIYNGALGVWDLSVAMGMSKPVLESNSSIAQLELSSMSHSTRAGGLTYVLRDDGFEMDHQPSLDKMQISGFTVGNVGYLYSASNSIDEGVYFTDGYPLVESFSAEHTMPLMENLFDLPFTMGFEIFIDHDAAGSSNFNAYNVIKPVPEPAPILFLGLGLAGLVGFGKMRRKYA